MRGNRTQMGVASLRARLRGGVPMDVEELSAVVVDTAFRLHRDLRPGLLESVYETVLARQLVRQGLSIERQKAVAFDYDGLHFDDGLRVDMLVEKQLIVELKSTTQVAPVHAKQVLTYLRLLDLRLGLLINFGAPTFKEGITRVVSGHTAIGSSRLHINRFGGSNIRR
jgi:iron complex transport system substrate-binding protein